MKIAINAVSAKMGGAVSYLRNLLRHLPSPESGYGFFVFLPDETAKLLRDIRGDIKLCVVPSKDTGGWRRLRWEQVTLRRFLRTEKIDALFSTANFAMLRCPVKQTLLVRNALYFSKTYRQMFLGTHGWRYRAAFALRRWMILQSVRSADLVMTPTQAMLDELAQFTKLARRKTLVNYYGAGRQDATSQGFSVPSAAAQSGVIRLIYISLYSEHKNLSTLLKAMPLLNRNGAAKFVLKTTVHPGWEGAAWTVTHKDDIMLARQPDVAPCVEFLGPLGRKEIQDLYREGDLFVFPSLCESFGQPMVEAMAHGLPIVAADTPVNREISGEAAIYFSPGSPEDLAEKVLVLGRDQALRQKLSIAGQRRAETYFRWEYHVDRLLKAVENPVSHRAGSA